MNSAQCWLSTCHQSYFIMFLRHRLLQLHGGGSQVASVTHVQLAQHRTKGHWLHRCQSFNSAPAVSPIRNSPSSPGVLGSLGLTSNVQSASPQRSHVPRAQSEFSGKFHAMNYLPRLPIVYSSQLWSPLTYVPGRCSPLDSYAHACSASGPTKQHKPQPLKDKLVCNIPCFQALLLPKRRWRRWR